MVIINLRELYPFYCEDCFVEISDEVAKAMLQLDRHEAAYQRKLYRHKAYYSLERDEGYKRGLVYVSMTPEEIYERKVSCAELHAAIALLPDKQAKRIFEFYFFDMNKAQIARAENVSEEAVARSIERGIKKVGEFLKKNR